MSQTQQMCSQGHLIFNEKCRACRDLRREWYGYLNRTGFVDVEKQTFSVGPRSSEFLEVNTYNAKLHYYSWAQSMLHYGQFRSTQDRIIWEHHSEGLSRRQIAPRVGLEQSWVTRKIQKIEGYLKAQTNRGVPTTFQPTPLEKLARLLYAHQTQSQALGSTSMYRSAGHM